MIKNKTFKKKLYNWFIVNVEKKFAEIKERKDKFFEPLVLKIPKLVTANQITIFRLIILALAFVLFIQYQLFFYIIIIILAITWFLDLIDGTVARLKRKTSVAGAYLDKIGDRMMWFMIYLLIFSKTMILLIFPLIYLEINFIVILSFSWLIGIKIKKIEHLNFTRCYLSFIWVLIVVGKLIF